MQEYSNVLISQAITVDLFTSFLLAILPIIVIFVGLVVLKQSGTLMGFVGWMLTVVIAVLFFSTSPAIALYATVNGILASFGISLMVLLTILQVTMMDVTGAIRSITEYIRLIAAERYEQVMLLNVGLGSFLVSIGATPVTMLPPIMLALGFSPLAAIALPCLGYDPLTSFSLLAVPITLPAQVFNLDLAAFGSQISLFLPVVSTGFAFGMLYIADGLRGMRDGFVPAIVAGLTLGLSAVFFVRVLPVSAIGLVGVFSGLVTIAVLLLLRVVKGKPILARRDDMPADVMPIRRAALPWLLLVFFVLVISIPVLSTGLYGLLGPLQRVTIVADRAIDLKLLNQAYTWVLVSTLISAPFLVRGRDEARKIVQIWLKRAWAPTFAAAIFFAIAYVMDWSGQTVINNTLTFAPGTADINMNAVIGLTLAMTFGVAFPAISPLLGLFGAFVSGSEASSNVMFHGILKRATGVLDLDFIKVYSAHAVAGGIASGIAPAKIINAAAVIDQLGMEGEVIRKCAPVALVLTIATGALLVLMLAI